MNENKNDELDPLGGQAVIEGVMMRSKTSYAVACRRKNGTIVYKKSKIPKWIGGMLRKIPIIRGAVMLIHSLQVGYDALTFSSNVVMVDEGEVEIKKSSFTVMLVFAIALGLLLFVGLPYLFTSLIQRFTGLVKEQLVFNIIDGIFRILLVLGYIWFISLSKEIRRVFEYHGAEHKTIANYEAKGKLDKYEIKKMSRFHPRCGTSFIIIILLLLIIVHTVVFSLTGPISVGKNIAIRILLIPLIAGFAYEIIKLSYRFPNSWIVRLLTYPGLFTQIITTREPDKSQIEVAVASLNILLDDSVNERDDLKDEIKKQSDGKRLW
ncbi:MAG: DUF1385 domain-containing protein [bacterium]